MLPKEKTCFRTSLNDFKKKHHFKLFFGENAFSSPTLRLWTIITKPSWKLTFGTFEKWPESWKRKQTYTLIFQFPTIYIWNLWLPGKPIYQVTEALVPNVFRELEDQVFFCKHLHGRNQVSGSVLASGGCHFFNFVTTATNQVACNNHRCSHRIVDKGIVDVGGSDNPTHWGRHGGFNKKNRLVLNAPVYRSFAHQFFPRTILCIWHSKSFCMVTHCEQCMGVWPQSDINTKKTQRTVQYYIFSVIKQFKFQILCPGAVLRGNCFLGGSLT